MLVSVIGNLGSGKTLFLTYLATKLKRPIYSNFKLKVPNYRKLELIDLIDLERNVNVFIDEAYAWIDSRVSGRAVNRYCSYVVLQSRKTFTDFFLTAQMFSTVDYRFRVQSNIIIYCKAIGKQIYKDMIVPEKFEYKILNRENQEIKYKSLDFYDAISYFDIYNTYEIIDSDEKESLEFHLIVKNPKRLKAKTKAIAKFIENDINEITHITVKYALFTNNIPIQYEPFVYAYLTGKVKPNE